VRYAIWKRSSYGKIQRALGIAFSNVPYFPDQAQTREMAERALVAIGFSVVELLSFQEGSAFLSLRIADTEGAKRLFNFRLAPTASRLRSLKQLPVYARLAAFPRRKM